MYSSIVNVFCYVNPGSVVKCMYITKDPVSSITLYTDDWQTRASGTSVSLHQNTQPHISRDNNFRRRENLKHRWIKLNPPSFQWRYNTDMAVHLQDTYERRISWTNELLFKKEPAQKFQINGRFFWAPNQLTPFQMFDSISVSNINTFLSKILFLLYLIYCNTNFILFHKQIYRSI
jgi:hypothetical protein